MQTLFMCLPSVPSTTATASAIHLIDSSLAPIIAACIAAIFSLVIAVVSLFFSYKLAKATASKEFARLSLEFKMRQLNDLYGRMLPLIEKSKMLWDKLTEDKPDKWHLLGHLEEVRDNARDMNLAKVISDVNDEIVKLLLENGGLIRGTVPESFKLYLKHQALVRMAMDGKDVGRIAEHEYYPKHFDQDVRDACSRLREEIDRTLTTYEHMGR